MTVSEKGKHSWRFTWSPQPRMSRTSWPWEHYRGFLQASVLPAFWVSDGQRAHRDKSPFSLWHIVVHAACSIDLYSKEACSVRGSFSQWIPYSAGPPCSITLGMKDSSGCATRGLAGVVVVGNLQPDLGTLACNHFRESKGTTRLALGSDISFSIQGFQIPASLPFDFRQSI